MRRRWIAVWLLWWPALLGSSWIIMNLVFEGYSGTRTLNLWVERNFLTLNPVLWFYLMTQLIGLGIIMAIDDWTVVEDDAWHSTRDHIRVGARSMRQENLRSAELLGLFVALAAILPGIPWVKGLWDNDKDVARYYNQATVFYVPDPQGAPSSVGPLVEGARRSEGSCDYVSRHDVPSCIKQGSLDEDGWEPRNSSLTAARYYISRTAGNDQRVRLRTETLTYLYGAEPGTGGWSGILDGSGTEKAINGVAIWSGGDKADVCTYKKGYSVGRAFGGDKRNDLRNLLADKYPRLIFSLIDVWGYCQGDKPVIVIPVVTPSTFKQQTVNRPAGVLIMRGSDQDQPVFEYRRQVKPNELPGPVYPISVVESQRDHIKWAAGRKNESRSSFGYEPTNAGPQTGNASEYLLRSQKDGRLYWVSPLTPRNSDSQLFVTYAVTAADEVSGGRLNTLKVYVLDSGDPRVVNVDDLEARTLEYLSRAAPGFGVTGGKVVEFTPTKGDNFRAFAEIKGRVVYRLEISASNRVAPKLVTLDASPETLPGLPQNQHQASPPGGIACGKPLNEQSVQELTSCMRQLVDEIERRQASPQTG